MKIKSIICLILAFLMVAALTACAGKAVPSSIDEDGKFVFNVVRSANSTAEQENAAKALRAAMKDNFDCK